jgi:hypothetical protein
MARGRTQAAVRFLIRAIVMCSTLVDEAVRRRAAAAGGRGRVEDRFEELPGAVLRAAGRG